MPEDTLHTTNNGDQSKSTVDEAFQIDEEYLIRDCDLYWDEYKDCKTIRSRFQQYFVYGEPQSCHQWKKDYDNCIKWTEKNDKKAASTLVESEKARRMERLKAHFGNNVWEKRAAPPDDWAKPLPDWMVKRDENTFLAQKSRELKDGKLIEEAKSSCCVM